jgi:gas vesicle protein
MNETTQQPRDYRFVFGLFTGAFVGAGLAVWLAPRLTSEVRERMTRMTESAKNLGQQASEKYQQASTRVGEAVDDLTRKGQDVRDDVAGAVARGAHEVARGAHEVERSAHEVERGAHEVERFATAAGSGRITEARNHSATGRSKPQSV